jgi:recombinational DNA repair protein RecR
MKADDGDARAHAARIRALYQAKRAHGLCGRCGRVPETGRSCNACKAYMRAAKLKFYAQGGSER